MPARLRGRAPRLMLHAAELTFPHPRDGRLLTVKRRCRTDSTELRPDHDLHVDAAILGEAVDARGRRKALVEIGEDPSRHGGGQGREARAVDIVGNEAGRVPIGSRARRSGLRPLTAGIAPAPAAGCSRR